MRSSVPLALALALALAALPLVVSCGDRPPDAEIAANVTVFSDAVAATINVQPDRLELPAAGNEWVLMLPQGQILVAGYRAGFLRRLSSVSRVGDRIVIPTVDAGLGDAIRKGKVSARLDLSQPPPMTAGNSLSQGLTGDDITTGIDVGGTEIFKNEKTSIKIGQGAIRMTPEVQLDYEYDGGLKYVDTGVSGDVDMALTLVIDSTETFHRSFDQPLWKSQPRYHVQFVGPVPVVEEVTLSLAARFEVQLDCGVAVEAGVAAKGNIAMGVRYENGTSTARYTNTVTGTTIGPIFQRSLNATAKVTLRPRVDVKFYALAGPFLETGVGFKATIALAPTRQWAIVGVVEAILGGQIKILGLTGDAGALLDKSITTDPWSQERLIASETINGDNMPLGCGLDGGSDMSTSGDMSTSDAAPVDLAVSDAGMSDATVIDMAMPADLIGADLVDRCINVPAPTKPDVAHLTFDTETAAGPLTSCGKALDLPSGVTRTANIGGDMTSGPFTFALWFKTAPPNTGNTYWYPVANTYTANGGENEGFAIRIHGNAFGLVWFETWSSMGEQGVVGARHFSSGEWHHLAVTSDGATMLIYIDGLARPDDFGQGAQVRPETSGRPLTLGYQPPVGINSYFGGQIDDLRIYRRPLTANEVRALSCSCHNATDAGAPDDLASPPDMSMSGDMAAPSCLTDAGTLVPPFPCDLGTDASTSAGYVVCAANCQSAWISAGATGGVYNALDICKSRGYQRLGSVGTTGGSVCGVMEQGTSCSNLGQRIFNGMGSLGGGTYGNAVQWECLP